MLSTLSQKRVLVTGAAGRLGRVVAELLADLNAHIIGVDVDDVGDGVHDFIRADLMGEEGVRETFYRAGEIDAVIHTVGTWAGKPFAETTLEEFDRIVRINMTMSFLVFREAVGKWTAAERGGQIVGIASRQGLEGGVAGQAGYNVSKAGVVRLIETVGHEYAQTGITAAGIAPSMILFGEEEEDTRGITAKRVAELCAYLATAEGGQAHNATVIPAYGSWL